MSEEAANLLCHKKGIFCEDRDRGKGLYKPIKSAPGNFWTQQKCFIDGCKNEKVYTSKALLLMHLMSKRAPSHAMPEDETESAIEDKA
ncbi:hypothetical protein N7495_003370 [Penicillium taxi]|uniref:uncharacterized protein n=1 Tax=Penicillium taxi TaxID=168475 RepID=UPI002545291A|nr:uncharacterized protein N7495_003370 [Penicillium taxi]KAJ5902842.1 hypothetical protein N7495_003370 [Penicillium taxi]